MPRARSTLISLEEIPFYHCVSRCVRRAFLCGEDATGRDYNHRRQWIEDRVFELSDAFAIDAVAFAILSTLEWCWAERDQLDRLAEQWRGNLMSISWFMRSLNEHIARKANAEDHSTGRFWQALFSANIRVAGANGLSMKP